MMTISKLHPGRAKLTRGFCVRFSPEVFSGFSLYNPKTRTAKSCKKTKGDDVRDKVGYNLCAPTFMLTLMVG